MRFRRALVALLACAFTATAFTTVPANATVTHTHAFEGHFNILLVAGIGLVGGGSTGLIAMYLPGCCGTPVLTGSSVQTVDIVGVVGT